MVATGDILKANVTETLEPASENTTNTTTTTTATTVMNTTTATTATSPSVGAADS